MSFPASTSTKQQALQTLCGLASSIKTRLNNTANAMEQGRATGSTLVSVAGELVSAGTTLTQLEAVTGLSDYAAEQFNRPDLDLFAERDVVVSKIQAVVGWIFNNLPTDTEGYFAVKKFNAQGYVEERAMSAEELAPLVALIRDVTSSID